MVDTPNNDTASGRLALQDGTVFTGAGFGARATMVGEVVFNTSMCGYQEALTDPSYRAQILTMTAPQMGNYGIAQEDVESSGVAVSGFIVRDLSPIHSNHRAIDDLAHWLEQHGVPGLQGIDTRALVRILRETGAMPGAISTDPDVSDHDLVALARSWEGMSGRNLASEVTPGEPGTWTEGLGEWGQPGAPPPRSGTVSSPSIAARNGTSIDISLIGAVRSDSCRSTPRPRRFWPQRRMVCSSQTVPATLPRLKR